jgi:hypothetical protein
MDTNLVSFHPASSSLLVTSYWSYSDTLRLHSSYSWNIAKVGVKHQSINQPPLITHRSIYTKTFISGLFCNWSVFSCFHKNINMYDVLNITQIFILDRLNRLWKIQCMSMIWLVDLAFIVNNPWVIATCSFPLFI